MKNRRDLPRFSERTGLIIAASVTGALVLLALLLPLAFRRSVPEPPPAEETVLHTEQRALLFAAYWTQEDAAEKPKTEKLSDPGIEMVERCAKRMRGLVETLVPDEALDYAAPTGSDYTRVDGPGESVSVCRMWLEAQGDWQNWMDVCFDADSGDLYYLYVSRSCLRNADAYRDAEPLTAHGTAEWLAGELDGTLRRFDETENGGVAVISTAGGTVCYGISCVSYDRLIDVKIQVS